MTDNNQTSQPAQQPTGVAGYTCSQCLLWVASGTPHYCPHPPSETVTNPVTHADPVPSPLPESVRNPDYTSQSTSDQVEPGEQQSSDNAAPAGTQINVPSCWPAPEPSPGPSQPVVLPPLDRTIEDKKRADTEFSHALRENQQLRQRIDEFSAIYEKCASDLEREFERAENLQQQLAQIRSAEVPDFDWDKMEAIAQDELCPECEGQEYCAACLAIKGTRWALKMKQTIAALKQDNAQKDKRIAELEGGK